MVEGRFSCISAQGYIITSKWKSNIITKGMIGDHWSWYEIHLDILCRGVLQILRRQEERPRVGNRWIWIGVPRRTGFVLLFWKSKNLLNRKTYHVIHHDGGLVFFKVNNSVQEIKHWLEEFQQTVDKAAGSQHLQFTVEICTNDTDLPPSANKDKVQIMSNN